MSNLLITNATVLLPDRMLEDYAVFCEDGLIKQIAPVADITSMNPVEIVDAKRKYLAPGFIDLHIHGIHNFIVDDGLNDLLSICKLLPQYGVTGFLPTICPLPKGQDAKFLTGISNAISEGAAILGVHLEGPFLVITGALPPDAIGKSDPERVKALEAALPHRAIFSISPDFENIGALISLMCENGAPVFMTHTAATVKQTQDAIKRGASHATHFYDVFYPSPVTEPGVRPCGAVETILAAPGVSVDFILDGEHVDPMAVQMALHCKGPDRVCLITDANKGAGFPPGKYKALGTEVEFKYPGGPARMAENTLCPGCLAGSGLTMDRAVRNAINMLDIDVPQAIRMASTNPAQVLRIMNKGQIKEGFDADMVLLDTQLNVERTWVAGKLRYSK